MTLRNLEVFLHVVEDGSMRGAAEKLYISQPSVSGAVSELERECGTLLFERMGKKLYITSAGKQLASYARRMLSLNDEIQRQMTRTDSTVRLRIGATITIGTCIMVDLIKRMKGVLPYVYVYNTRDIEKKLLANELDIALVEGQVQHEELITEPVMKDRLVLICAKDHPYAKYASVSIKKLAGQSMILREQGSVSRKLLEKVLEEAEVTIEPLWECYNTEAILRAVEGGLGVAVMSEKLMKGRDSVVGIPLTGCRIERSFYLVYHKDKFINSRLEEFMVLCRTMGITEER